MGHDLAFYLTTNVQFDVTYMGIGVVFNVNGTCVIHTFCLTVDNALKWVLLQLSKAVVTFIIQWIHLISFVITDCINLQNNNCAHFSLAAKSCHTRFLGVSKLISIDIKNEVNFCILVGALIP